MPATILDGKATAGSPATSTRAMLLQNVVLAAEPGAARSA